MSTRLTYYGARTVCAAYTPETSIAGADDPTTDRVLYLGNGDDAAVIVGTPAELAELAARIVAELADAPRRVSDAATALAHAARRGAESWRVLGELGAPSITSDMGDAGASASAERLAATHSVAGEYWAATMRPEDIADGVARAADALAYAGIVGRDYADALGAELADAVRLAELAESYADAARAELGDDDAARVLATRYRRELVTYDDAERARQYAAALADYDDARELLGESLADACDALGQLVPAPFTVGTSPDDPAAGGILWDAEYAAELAEYGDAAELAPYWHHYAECDALAARVFADGARAIAAEHVGTLHDAGRRRELADKCERYADAATRSAAGGRYSAELADARDAYAAYRELAELADTHAARRPGASY